MRYLFLMKNKDYKRMLEKTETSKKIADNVISTIREIL